MDDAFQRRINVTVEFPLPDREDRERIWRRIFPAETPTDDLDGLGSAPYPVVLPAHPRTAERLREFGLSESATDGLRVVEPVGYLDFLRLVEAARVVATDSGGVQKEAFYLDTPCVTLREETEWVETVEAGGNVLVGADADRISRALASPPTASSRQRPYGDGNAAERIVEALEVRR
jgi:UDP-N-acetylglucosamine 2-epimerase (non-hydrolysing)